MPKTTDTVVVAATITPGGVTTSSTNSTGVSTVLNDVNAASLLQTPAAAPGEDTEGPSATPAATPSDEAASAPAVPSLADARDSADAAAPAAPAAGPVPSALPSNGSDEEAAGPAYFRTYRPAGQMPPTLTSNGSSEEAAGPAYFRTYRRQP